MIGLKRNTVKVVDYDPGWAMLALEYCRVVRNACGELLADVLHVGSTAVPELPAKPILDIAAALATIDSTPEIVRRLTFIGYFDRGDQGDAGTTYLSLSLLRTSERSICVVAHGSRRWREYLHFRDPLRQKPATRKKYADLETRPCEHLPG
jgi:GrpB-like predicted nucleotidyltransferase (UPF0157 family)